MPEPFIEPTQIKKTPLCPYGEVNSKDGLLWEKIVSDWQSSGLSQKQFCIQNGLNKHTLSYWRSKIIARSKAKAQSTQPKGFVPLQIPAQQAVTEVLKLQSPTGYVLSIPITVIDKILPRLFSLLEPHHA